jgi:Na+-transporting methylmalonyl-CoA/oxaloacetate decarboxylase gamma subunit
MRSTFLRIFLILFAGVSFFTATGQGVKSLCINEGLIKESNYVNSYVIRCGLFDVFNAANVILDMGRSYAADNVDSPEVDAINGEKQKAANKFDIIIMVTGVTVVFVMLVVFVILFRKLRESLKYRREAQIENTKKETKQVETGQITQDANELDFVAISTALYLYFDNQHDIEQNGFWLNRKLNQQTAWSTKNILFKKSPIRKY